MDPQSISLGSFIQGVQVTALPELRSQEGQALAGLVGQDVEALLETLVPGGARLNLGGAAVTAQGELPFPEGTLLLVRVLPGPDGSVRLQTLEAQPPSPPALLAPLLQGEALPLLARLLAADLAPGLEPLRELVAPFLATPAPTASGGSVPMPPATLPQLSPSELQALVTLFGRGVAPSGEGAAAAPAMLPVGAAGGRPGADAPAASGRVDGPRGEVGGSAVLGNATSSALPAQGTPPPGTEGTEAGPAHQLPRGLEGEGPAAVLPSGSPAAMSSRSSALVPGSAVLGQDPGEGRAALAPGADAQGVRPEPGNQEGRPTSPQTPRAGSPGQAPEGAVLPLRSDLLPPILRKALDLPVQATGADLVAALRMRLLPPGTGGSSSAASGRIDLLGALEAQLERQPWPLSTRDAVAGWVRQALRLEDGPRAGAVSLTPEAEAWLAARLPAEVPPASGSGVPASSSTLDPAARLLAFLFRGTPEADAPARVAVPAAVRDASLVRFQAWIAKQVDLPAPLRQILTAWAREVLPPRLGTASDGALLPGPREEAGLAARLLRQPVGGHPSADRPELWKGWVEEGVRTLADPVRSPREAPLHQLQALDHTAFFELPLPWMGGAAMQMWVEWEGEGEAKPGGRPGETRVLLEVPFSRLGSTRVGLRQSGAQLQVRIWTARPDLLRSEEASLTQELRGLDRLVDLRILPLPEGAPGLRSLAGAKGWEALG